MKNVRPGHGHPIVCINAGHSGQVNRSPVVPEYYESEMTWKLHNYLSDALEKYGIEVRKTREDQATGLALYARGEAAEGCDLWLSLHSNAVDNAESVDRPIMIHMVADDRTEIDEQSKELAVMLGKTIYEVMQTNGEPQITSKKAGTDIDRDGKLNDEWYAELRGAHDVGVPGLILEHSFHTNTRSAKWLLQDENLQRLAEAEAATIAVYFGVEALEEEQPVESRSIYRVQVGAFRVKENAENMLQQVKAAGFDGIIVEAEV